MNPSLTKPRLLFLGPDQYAAPWSAAFAEQAPEIAFEIYEPGQALSGIPYCLTWKAPPGLWPRMTDLKVLFSLAAGVDRLLGDPSFPRDIPLVRMVEPELTRGMAEYVLWQCLYHHRRVWELEAAQSCGEWRPHTYPAPWDRTIGILGLGEIGAAAAAKLVEFGFKVRGWSRSPKSLSMVESFAGRDQLPAFLKETEILVCLLPLTPETQGILNADLFAHLPKGASLINAGRGGHLIEADLPPAMQSGRIGAATLDVFETEPLPEDHPFWTTERLYITPHNASDTDPRSAAWQIGKQIARYEAGEKLENIVDRQRGY
jgi:glyoxylate/hydroxypyruvate reductase A